MLRPEAQRAMPMHWPDLESAKLQALYNFAYGLSHEINNPLANIATRAETLLADEADPQRRRKLATIVQQAFRAHEMIADLMLFARPPALAPAPVDLAQLADMVVGELSDQAREQGTQLVRIGAPSPLVAVADPTQLAVALKALLQNSLEAIQAGGRVAIAVEANFPGEISERNREEPRVIATPTAENQPAENQHVGNGGWKLSVSDTGPGIAPSIRPHIFDPFYSGREAGRGLGLGLSKAWRIADLHGGRIDVESEAGAGATFTIWIPARS
jgi:signal transduction histidine kinase